MTKSESVKLLRIEFFKISSGFSVVGSVGFVGVTMAFLVDAFDGGMDDVVATLLLLASFTTNI